MVGYLLVIGVKTVVAPDRAAPAAEPEYAYAD